MNGVNALSPIPLAIIQVENEKQNVTPGPLISAETLIGEAVKVLEVPFSPLL